MQLDGVHHRGGPRYCTRGMSLWIGSTQSLSEIQFREVQKGNSVEV